VLNVDSKSVPGYENRYTINKQGQIYSIPRRGTKGGYLKPSPDGHGYLRVSLYNVNGKRRDWRIHTLVLLAFVGPSPVGMQGCHNNGNQRDNKLENLRWDTASNNNLDKRKHGTSGGSRNGRAKLTPWQVEEIRLRYQTESVSYSRLARDYGVDKSTIGRVVCKKSWTREAEANA
jgi:hypothetical protein